MTPKCLYIAGYGRSGSTLLDTMLSNIDGYHGIGEACNLFDELLRGNPCSCGLSFDACPHWGKFVRGLDWKELDRQRKQHEGWRGLLYRPTATEYGNFWKNYFQEMARSGQVVVDSSKVNRPNLARALFLKRLGVDVWLLPLYRAPTGLLSSVLKGSNKDLARGVVRKGLSRHLFIIRSFLGALFSYLAVAALCKAGVPSTKEVVLERLLVDPAKELSRIGIAHAPSRDDALLPGHAVAGNRMRRYGEIQVAGPGDSAPVDRVPFLYEKLFHCLHYFRPTHSGTRR